MRIKFDFLGRKWSFSSYKVPPALVGGYTNYVPIEDRYVVFADYDTIREDVFVRDLVYLQETFQLGTFYAFRTLDLADRYPTNIPVGNYHSVCVDEVTTWELINILRCSKADYAFVNAPRRNPEKDWVLRLEPKGVRDEPVLLQVVESPYDGKRVQSLGHAMVLEAICGLDIVKTLTNSDGHTDVELVVYNTANRLEVK